MAASKPTSKNAGIPAPVTKALPSVNDIAAQVLLLRGQKVLLAQQLAILYGVETRALNQAVQRNLARFPPDFMFQLNADEAELSRSQMVILNNAPPAGREVLRSQDVSLKRGANIKYLPYAFTEQGIAMLSSVLKSERAIAVNIEIVRTFITLRGMLADHKDLSRKLSSLERKYDENFRVVFAAIRELMSPKDPPKKRRIGFVQD